MLIIAETVLVICEGGYVYGRYVSILRPVTWKTSVGESGKANKLQNGE